MDDKNRFDLARASCVIDYDKMYEYVQNLFEEKDAQLTKAKKFPFRKRSEHCRRVFMWAERLIDNYELERDVLLTAAMLHDIGYVVRNEKAKHAVSSAKLCKKYLKDNGYDDCFIKKVTYLVENHSDKHLLKAPDTKIELVLLLEADLLDETGAMSIVWDCMAEGMEQVQSFEKTFAHIAEKSQYTLEVNPMLTTKAKEYWEEKKNLTRQFVEHLKADLGMLEAR